MMVVPQRLTAQAGDHVLGSHIGLAERVLDRRATDSVRIFRGQLGHHGAVPGGEGVGAAHHLQGRLAAQLLAII
jgi:hypothetical protein